MIQNNTILHPVKMTTTYVFWVILLTSVLADKDLMLKNQMIEPWILRIDFDKIFKTSFLFSKCCNVYFNGTTKGVDELFQYFVRAYPYDYVVLKKKYNCHGYLLIASEEDKLLSLLSRVPSRIPTTELLIILDYRLTNKSQLFNASMYQNANVNLVTPSGTWSLSANYLELRKFNKISRNNASRNKKILANFRGRELQTASFYNPPMCYLKRTVNRTVRGIDKVFFLADNDSERDGVEFQILMLIAEKLNFSFSVREPSGEFRYGRQMNDTWHGGMIGQVMTKEIDVAFGSIWLKSDHNQFVNLTMPWDKLFITFLVPRPKRYASFWALTKPFTSMVWISVFGILLCQSAYMTARAFLRSTEETARYRDFSYTCMELIGRLTGTWMPRIIKGSRFQIHFWHSAGLVLVAAYSSSLAARLASSEYEPRIDDVRSFIDSGLVWGRQGPVPVFHDYFDLDDVHEAMLPDRYEHEETSEDRSRKMRQGNYAVLGRLVGGVFFPEGTVANDMLHDYRVMRTSFVGYYSCFAIQPWLLESFNTMIMWISQAGLNAYHLRDVIHRRAGSSLREVLIERDHNDGSFRNLAFVPLAIGFITLIVGLFIASIVFYLEFRVVAK